MVAVEWCREYDRLMKVILQLNNYSKFKILQHPDQN
jgi:hypothetical protein